MRSQRSAVVLMVVALLVAFPMIADARGSREATSDDATLTATGRIVVNGNHPNEYLAINLAEPANGTAVYRLEGALADQLKRDHQRDIVTLRIEVIRESRGPGDTGQAVVVEIVSTGAE